MINRIIIRDFKSIREVDLKLDPVTVLVGRSGTGKSNLVQSIRFVRNLLLNYEEALNYEFGWQHIVPVGELKPRTSFEVYFSIPGDDSEYSYRLGFGMLSNNPFPGPVYLKEERLNLGGESFFHAFARIMDSGNGTKHQTFHQHLSRMATLPCLASFLLYSK